LQVFDFIAAKFANVMVFEFFLMTAEYTEFFPKLFRCDPRASAVDVPMEVPFQ
jgi:hypothetical protein